MMRERPILFSAPMVRAILEGRKTQTRRVAKHVLADGDGWHLKGVGGGMVGCDDDSVLTDGADYAPYAPGDRLWVKETWKPGSWQNGARVAVDYRASPEMTNTPWITLPDTADWHAVWERWTRELVANGSEANVDGIHTWQPGQSPLKWRPSIFMPRWASRITLTVTDVRVERLQNISEADAVAEGIEPAALTNHWRDYGPDPMPVATPVESFKSLWRSINTKPGKRWEDNPWVTAIGFEVLKAPRA